MGGARAHVLAPQKGEAAGALGAQHDATHQTQGGVLPLHLVRPGTPWGGWDYKI